MRPARQAWRRSDDGNVAFLFALMLLPIFVIVGFAIDASRRVSADFHLQYSIDAAAFAGARALEDEAASDADIVMAASNIFIANMESGPRYTSCAAPRVFVNRAETAVSVEAECQFASLFGGQIQGVDILGVANGATAQANLISIDLALAIDVSSSMAPRMAAVRDVATAVAETLITSRTGERVRIGLVGYGDVVNPGGYGNLALGRNWFDDRDGNGVDTVCVTQRTGPTAFTDDRPVLGAFVAEAPPYAPCVVEGFLPLTSDLDLLRGEIAALQATGLTTAGHLGVAWSWYLISPRWRSIWPTASDPLAYNHPNSIKASVIITDGIFNVAWNPAYAANQSPNLARTLCQGMRNRGILVYTISFQAPPEAAPLLRDCAGGDDRFYTAENAQELNDVLQSIASELVDLGLSS